MVVVVAVVVVVVVAVGGMGVAGTVAAGPVEELQEEGSVCVGKESTFINADKGRKKKPFPFHFRPPNGEFLSDKKGT